MRALWIDVMYLKTIKGHNENVEILTTTHSLTHSTIRPTHPLYDVCSEGRGKKKIDKRTRVDRGNGEDWKQVIDTLHY